MKASSNKLGKIIHWTLLLIVALYIISGLGILYYRIIETITFGILTKALAYKIHVYLLIPFLTVLIAHIVISNKNKNKKK